MRNSEIRPALDATRAIKMQKIDDKDFRKQLIATHQILYKVAKDVDTEIDALRDAHLSSYDEEVDILDDLQMRLQVEPSPAKRAEILAEIESHAEAKKAIMAYNKALKELLDEEVKFALPTIDEEKFMEEYGKQEYLPSVYEGLFPLFKSAE